jgi:ElaA protein
MKIEAILHNNNTYVLLIKSFEELTLEQLYEVCKIRQEVFVVEQNCAFIDTDGYDKKALHLMLKDEQEQLLAYARVVDKGIIYKEATIGRVLTIAAARKSGLGRILFSNAIDTLFTHYGIQAIKIQAQSYLVDFYKSFGFEVVTESYLDTGIYHNDMIKYV